MPRPRNTLLSLDATPVLTTVVSRCRDTAPFAFKAGVEGPTAVNQVERLVVDTHKPIDISISSS